MNLYAINTSTPAAYVPPTWHGGWTTTPGTTGAYTKMLEPTTKWALNGQSSVSVTGTGAGPLTVAMRRFVSRKLAAQTISGTLDVVLGALQALSTDDFVWKCYAWVSVGDTDVERGVVLDYTEVLGVGGATAFPTTRTGKSFASAQALSSVAAQEGDRLVIEIGGSTTTVTGGNHVGSVEVGVWGFDGAAYADLAVAETPTTARAGFFVYSGTLTLSSTEPTNISPLTAAAVTFPTTPTITSISPQPTFQSLDLWYSYAPGLTDTVVSFFAGRDVSATYEPRVDIFRGPIDASFEALAGYSTDATPNIVRAPAAITTYYRLISTGSGAIAGSIFLYTQRVPELPPGDYNGAILITPDSGITPREDQFTYVIDGATGTVLGIVLGTTPTENGAMVGYAQRWLNGDENNLADLVLFNALTLTEITRISGVISASVSSGLTPISASGDRFYVAQYRVDLGAIVRLLEISVDGVPGATWDMASPGGAILGMWTTYDNTIAYYNRGGVLNQPIKRWDLINDVALPDFLPGDPVFSPREVLALRDNSVLVMYNKPGATDNVERYDPNGVLLQTYDIIGATGGGATFLDHFRQGIDDPVSFWVWAQNGTTATGYLVHVRTSDGAILAVGVHTLFAKGLVGPEVAPGDLPPIMFGAPDSCPLLLVLTTGPGGGPGPGPVCPGVRGAPLLGV